MQKIQRQPIVNDRVRRIGSHGFCFIPHKFLHDGFFASLNQGELLLYFFLILAGDRQGVSFYGYDKICSLLQMPLEIYLQAKRGLVNKDLIAFDGNRFQVLELPKQPIRADNQAIITTDDEAMLDPACVRQIIQQSLCDSHEV